MDGKAQESLLSTPLATSHPHVHPTTPPTCGQSAGWEFPTLTTTVRSECLPAVRRGALRAGCALLFARLFAVTSIGTTVHSPALYPTPGLPPATSEGCQLQIHQNRLFQRWEAGSGVLAAVREIQCSLPLIAFFPLPSASCLRLWPPTNNVSQCPRRVSHCPRRVSHEGRDRPVRLCPKAGAGARTTEGVSSPPLFFSLPARPILPPSPLPPLPTTFAPLLPRTQLVCPVATSTLKLCGLGGVEESHVP